MEGAQQQNRGESQRSSVGSSRRSDCPLGIVQMVLPSPGVISSTSWVSGAGPRLFYGDLVEYVGSR